MYATGDIVKTRQYAPYDHVPGWRIVIAIEVAPLVEQLLIAERLGQRLQKRRIGAWPQIVARSANSVIFTSGIRLFRTPTATGSRNTTRSAGVKVTAARA